MSVIAERGRYLIRDGLRTRGITATVLIENRPAVTRVRRARQAAIKALALTQWRFQLPYGLVLIGY